MHGRRTQELCRFFWLAAVLFAVWLLLSGKFELRFILTGAGASLVTAFVCMPFLTVQSLDGRESFFLFQMDPVKTVLYFLWLLKEILLSSLAVSREVLRLRMRYSPQIVFFSMPLSHPMARAMLANSITLTPGTITLDVSDEGVFAVHTLTAGMGDALLQGKMARKVAALYGETCDFEPLPQRQLARQPKEGGVV